MVAASKILTRLTVSGSDNADRHDYTRGLRPPHRRACNRLIIISVQHTFHRLRIAVCRRARIGELDFQVFARGKISMASRESRKCFCSPVNSFQLPHPLARKLHYAKLRGMSRETKMISRVANDSIKRDTFENARAIISDIDIYLTGINDFGFRFSRARGTRKDMP